MLHHFNNKKERKKRTCFPAHRLLHSHLENRVKQDVKLVPVKMLLSSLFCSLISSPVCFRKQCHRCLPVAQNGKEQQEFSTCSLWQCHSLTFINGARKMLRTLENLFEDLSDPEKTVNYEDYSCSQCYYYTTLNSLTSRCHGNHCYPYTKR